MKTPAIVFLLAAGLMFSGCQFPSSRPLVASSAVNTTLTPNRGTVTDIRLVTIEGHSTQLGHNAGLIGAAAGFGIGHGTGKALAVTGGLVAGEAIGVAAEEWLTRKAGQTLTVKLDNGRTVVVTQIASAKVHIGDEVLVVQDGAYSEVLLPSS